MVFGGERGERGKPRFEAGRWRQPYVPPHLPWGHVRPLVLQRITGKTIRIVGLAGNRGGIYTPYMSPEELALMQPVVARIIGRKNSR